MAQNLTFKDQNFPWGKEGDKKGQRCPLKQAFSYFLYMPEILTTGMRTVQHYTQLLQLASPVPVILWSGAVQAVGRLAKGKEMMELFVSL